MSQYTAWEHWIQTNVVIIMLIMSLGFGALIWLAKLQRDQRKEFKVKKDALEGELAAKQKEIEDSEMAKLVVQIKNLVEQIQFLFQRHDTSDKEIKGLHARVGNVEKRISEGFAHCADKQNAINELKSELHEISVGGHRKADCPTDRSDREN